MDYALGIASGPVFMAAGDKILSEILMVINLAVEYYTNIVVLVGHRLLPGIQIDDTQTPETQPYISINIQPLVIGAAIGHDIPHPDQEVLIHKVFPTPVGYSANTAHNVFLSDPTRMAILINNIHFKLSVKTAAFLPSIIYHIYRIQSAESRRGSLSPEIEVFNCPLTIFMIPMLSIGSLHHAFPLYPLPSCPIHSRNSSRKGPMSLNLIISYFVPG